MRLTIALLLCCLSTSNLTAADVGVIGAQAWTNDEDLGNPTGYGFFITDHASERFSIQLEYRHFRHQREVLGWTTWFAPEPIEPVLLNSVLTCDSFDADVLMRLREIDGIALLFGPGVSLNKFRLNRESYETNPPRDNHKADRLGLSLSTQLSAASILATPFRFNLSFKVKHVLSDKTYMTDAWNPSTNGVGIYEVDVGLAYIFD